MALTKIEIVNSIADQIRYPKNHSSEKIETLLEIIGNSSRVGWSGHSFTPATDIQIL
jgi:nucleoid DNA-binding protein